MGKQARERREKWSKVNEARAIEGLKRRVRIVDIARATSKVMRRRLDGQNIVIDATEISQYVHQEFAKVAAGYEPYFGYWKDKFSIRLPYDQMVIEWRGDGKKDDHALVTVEAVADGDDALMLRFKPYFCNSNDPFKKYDWGKHSKDEWLSVGVSQYDVDLDPFEEYDTETVVTSLAGNILECSIDDNRRYPHYQVTVLMTLALLTCKNIVLLDHPSNDADDLLYERHFGVPLTKYKTLVVKSMSKGYERGDQPQQQFDVMPLHLRRGNFAHYTDDAPLFGKYTGTFWRPATVVGNSKNGVVVKDYKVMPPDEGA